MGFDWVQARAECSLERIFELLREVVDSDVKSVGALGRRDVKFRLSTDAVGKLIVIRERNLDGSKEVATVAFERTGGYITARRATVAGPEPPFLKAAPSLTEDGECLLEVEGLLQSLKLWQVSRRALEDLFFGI